MQQQNPSLAFSSNHHMIPQHAGPMVFAGSAIDKDSLHAPAQCADKSRREPLSFVGLILFIRIYIHGTYRTPNVNILPFY